MPTVQATIISGFPVLRLGQDAQPSVPRAGSNHTNFRAIGRASFSTSPGGSGSFSARPFSHSFCRSGTSEEASSPQPVKSPDSGIRLGRIGQDCACPRSHGTIKAGKGRVRPFGRGVRCDGDLPGRGCAGPTASRAEGIPPPRPASSPTTGPRQHGRVGFFWR